MSVLQTMRVVARKELLDGIRDRRSVLSALLFPLFGPVLIAVMFSIILAEEADDGPIALPVVGPGNAVALIEHLESQGIEVVPAPEDPRAAVASGDENVVLEIHEDFEAEFRAGRPAPVSMYIDSSRREGRVPVRRVRKAVETYSAKVGTLRLLARGIDPQLARPIAVGDIDTATPQQKAANLLAMVPMFVMLAVFVGGMFMATDATAGERERKSLEPLLLTPTSRAALVLGKWAATTVFSTTGLCITLVGSSVAMGQIPLEEVGLDVDLGPGDMTWVLALLLPLAPMAAALQMLVASFAKSFREAQTYLSLLTMLPTLPGVFLTLEPLPPEGGASCVPVLGQQVLLLGVLRGDAIPLLPAVGSTAVVALLTIGCLWATSRLLGSEKTIFGE
ncbi:MAG: ABC transporter permease [Nannocystaceae bacterium]|nr:ABC transporter permease [bacterium]